MAKELSPGNYPTPSAQNANDLYYVYSGADNQIRTLAFLFGVERSTDPSDPPEGCFAIWQSNGVGSGDDGDILIKVTAGGVTKTAILFDFSSMP